jgi:hypothetical protein
VPLTHWPIHDLMDHNLDKLRRADLKNATGTGRVARTAKAGGGLSRPEVEDLVSVRPLCWRLAQSSASTYSTE